jgi:Ca2+-binding RTX toxin-like protein
MGTLGYELSRPINREIARTNDGTLVSVGGFFQNSLSPPPVILLISPKTGVGAVRVVVDTDSIDGNSPDVAILSDGNIVVNWEDIDGIKVQIYSPQGMPLGSEITVNSFPSIAKDATITNLSGGGFVVSWVDQSSFTASSTDIISHVFDANGILVGAGGIAVPTVGDGSYAGGLSVGALAGGGFVTTWTRATATVTDFDVQYLVHHSNGSAIFNGRVDDNYNFNGTVTRPAPGFEGAPTVAGLADGSFVIGWGQVFGGDNLFSGIAGRRFDAAGRPLAGEFSVSGPTPNANDAKAVVLDDGNFIFAFADGQNRIVAQYYHQSGQAIGKTFTVQNTSTLGIPPDFIDITSIAAGDGRFSLAYNSFRILPTQITSVGPGSAGGFTDINLYLQASLITSAGGGNAGRMTATENVADIGQVQALKPSKVTFASTGSDPVIRADSGLKVIYSIVGGSDGSLFRINPDTGVLSFAQGADFEQPRDSDGDNVYEVSVQSIVSVKTAGVYGGDYLVFGDAGGTITKSGIYGGNFYSVGATFGADHQNLSISVVDSAIETVIDGTSANNVLRAGTAATVINGREGADKLYGGTGADFLYGGTGSDTYFIGTGDQVIEYAWDTAIDTISSAEISFALSDNVEKGLLTGVLALDITGNPLTNTLTGNSGNNRLDGGNGKDTIDGKAGNDQIIGGTDIDKLTGGLGNDTLQGGTGADTFVFGAEQIGSGGANRDLILDFSTADVDKINLTSIDANSTLAGNQAFQFIGTGAFAAGVLGQIRYVSAGGLTTISGDINGDTVADFSIDLAGTPTLMATSFML